MSKPGIRLIAGLGNPGPDYAATRHNAGAWFVAALAERHAVTLKREARFSGLHAVIREYDTDLHLLIPTTFMNLSGQAVSQLAQYYQLTPQHILVAHDELDIPVGDIRLKFDGGHGGHNGLRDIISHLGSNAFHRLRIGIGHPGKGRDVTQYVLSPPGKAERKLIDDAMLTADALLPRLLAGEFQIAVHSLHTVSIERDK